MKKKLNRVVVVLAIFLCGSSAHAAISCSLSALGLYALYDGLAATDNLNQSSYTLNCTRLSTDASTLNYIAFTDDGLYNNGANNRAKHTLSNNHLRYDFFTSSSYAVNWSKSSKCIIGSVNFGTALSARVTVPYFSKIPAAQTGIPQGTYTDTVTASVAYNQTACQNGVVSDLSSTFQVELSNVPACQMVTPPGSVNFTYTAFTTTDAIANTTFQTRCSTTLPYTIALNGSQSGGLYPGVVSGVNYSLSIGTSTIGAPILPTTNLTGNGSLQLYFINGKMAAGQAGTCTGSICTATDPRMLTITY